MEYSVLCTDTPLRIAGFTVLNVPCRVHFYLYKMLTGTLKITARQGRVSG